MTKCSLKGDGSDVFLMENKVCTFCRIPYLWQGWMETRNLSAFSTLRDFLDRHDKNRPPGTQVNIMQNLENLSVQFLSYHCWQKNLIVEASGLSLCSLDCISDAKVMDDFPENSIDMVTDYWFQTIFKEMSLDWSAVVWFFLPSG